MLNLNKQIPINNPVADSLSLKIPLANCVVKDNRLTSMTCLYYETINEFDEQLNPPKPLIFETNGVKVRFGLCTINIHDKEQNIKIPTQFVNITISSKLLYYDYFKGITKETIFQIYQEFIKYNIVYCDFNIFTSGIISDIDICVNLYSASQNTFIDVLHYLQNSADQKKKFTRIINEITNKGISFNKRDFATPSLPFIKIYHKELELLNNSTYFYNKFLFDDYCNVIQNLTRLEATIKNYKHKERLKKYGIFKTNFRTLGEFLEVPQSELNQFLTFSISSYLEKKPKLKAPNLSPTEHIIFNAIQLLITTGSDLETIINYCITDFKGSTDESTRVSKSRMKKTIKSLYDMIIMTDLKIKNQAQHNAHVNEYLTQLNIL